MDFRLLGPLEAFDRGSPLQIAVGKQRALLAFLLLNANRTVARDRIVDALWGDDAPDSAQKMVQIHISQLRKALPEPRLRTRAPGYLAEVGDDELDLVRFERDSLDARDALARGDPAHASMLLRRALALWRGPALAEFSEPFARHEAARLEELRVAAVESRVEADLALGHHRDVVAELETLVAEHPLRERLRSMHMLALYRSGRHAEALASYHAFRRKLADELGIEPSSSLRELERVMLQQDPSLELPPSRPRPVAAADAESDVRYARSGDVRIAHQVVGEGPLDLVLVHGWVCTFHPAWENPTIAAFYRRLASMGRLILFDKRGTGLSDRVSPERLPDLDTRMDDVRAVMDAVGSERAVVLGIHEGGAMSALFAAMHPERTLGLVLMGTFARLLRAPDYAIGIDEADYRRRLTAVDEDDWAAAVTEEWLGRVEPELARDPAALRWYTSYVMRGAGPGANRAIRDMNAEIDVRDVLPTVNVPTLVLYRAGEYFREGTRYMGERIPGATVVELPGTHHLPWEDARPLLDEVERFLQVVRDEAEPERMLATLLVAEVASPAPAAPERGDALARHRRLVRTHLARFRGREAGAVGDAVLATFDGPARAVRCAGAIVASAHAQAIDVRVGVHAGEIERRESGLSGPAVDVAATIAAAAERGQVLVSSTVRDLVAGSGIAFEQRAERKLPGVRGTCCIFAAARE